MSEKPIFRIELTGPRDDPHYQALVDLFVNDRSFLANLVQFRLGRDKEMMKSWPFELHVKSTFEST